MCIISDKIKFCTCFDEDIEVEELDHYWVLLRYNEDRNSITFGTILPPLDKFSKNYIKNQFKISNALLEKEAFDKPINFKEKDRLQIVINNNADHYKDTMQFDFEYKLGKW